MADETEQNKYKPKISTENITGKSLQKSYDQMTKEELINIAKNSQSERKKNDKTKHESSSALVQQKRVNGLKEKKSDLKSKAISGHKGVQDSLNVLIENDKKRKFLLKRKRRERHGVWRKSWHSNQFFLKSKDLDQNKNLSKDRQHLPVWKTRDEFMKAFDDNRVIIVVGDTGCGKSSQIPQWCAGLVPISKNKIQKSVVCTQPRRVAAINLAKRVAKEVGVKLGTSIGYKVRFDKKISKSSILNYFTDGMLLREAISDPLLKNYRVIILDEVHERSVATDILLGFCKRILKSREDVKIVIMSATIHPQKYLNFFECGYLLKIPGSMFPVKVLYEEEDREDYDSLAINKVIDIHKNDKESGDILVFLTGQSEIEYVCDEIDHIVKDLGNNVGELECLPFYSALPLGQQNLVFGPTPPNRLNGAVGRKVIVATNIAETSLTIDNLKYVIDAGYSKQKKFDSEESMEQLIVMPISKQNAAQRQGRVGRTSPGTCYRLYTNSFYEKLDEGIPPQILGMDLCSVVLQLKKAGIDDVLKFKLMDKLNSKAINRALYTLRHLEAINDKLQLTELGKKLSDYPLEPILAKMLINSTKFKCINEMLTIVSMVSVQPCFCRPKKERRRAKKSKEQFLHVGSDHLTLMNAMNAFLEHDKDKEWTFDNYLNYGSLANAADVRNQLMQIMQQQGYNWDIDSRLPKNCLEKIIKVISLSTPMQVAMKMGKTEYKTLEAKNYSYIHPASIVSQSSEFVIFTHQMSTKRQFMKNVSVIPEDMVDPEIRKKLQKFLEIKNEDEAKDEPTK